MHLRVLFSNLHFLVVIVFITSWTYWRQRNLTISGSLVKMCYRESSHIHTRKVSNLMAAHARSYPQMGNIASNRFGSHCQYIFGQLRFQIVLYRHRSPAIEGQRKGLRIRATARPSKFGRMQAGHVGHEELVICVKTGGQIAQTTLVTWPFHYYTQAAHSSGNRLRETISMEESQQYMSQCFKHSSEVLSTRIQALRRTRLCEVCQECVTRRQHVVSNKIYLG